MCQRGVVRGRGVRREPSEEEGEEEEEKEEKEEKEEEEKEEENSLIRNLTTPL